MTRPIGLCHSQSSTSKAGAIPTVIAPYPYGAITVGIVPASSMQSSDLRLPEDLSSSKPHETECKMELGRNFLCFPNSWHPLNDFSSHIKAFWSPLCNVHRFHCVHMCLTAPSGCHHTAPVATSPDHSVLGQRWSPWAPLSWTGSWWPRLFPARGNELKALWMIWKTQTEIIYSPRSELLLQIWQYWKGEL